MLPPALFSLVRGVHVFGAQGAAVGFAQRIEQLAQRHSVFAEEGVAGVKNRLLVSIAKTVKSRIQILNGRTLGALERVQVCPALTYISIGCNELLYGSPFTAHFSVGAGQNNLGAAGFGALGKGVDDGLVRHVFGIAAVGGGHMLKRIKILAPGFRHAAGIGQVVFVKLFDVRRVATEKISIALIGGVHRCRCGRVGTHIR